MPAIERDSPIPLYFQLKQLLAERIAAGEWQPGDMLPTEGRLGEQFGLSRTTVRQALKELELEGRISRYRGKGTFVTRPKIRHSPDPKFSLTDFLLRQGIKPGWRLISYNWVPAMPEVAEKLSLAEGSVVFQLCRLRLANEEPIGYHAAHSVSLPTGGSVLTKPVTETQFLHGGSLDYLRGLANLDGSYANRVIEAIAASDHTARYLDIAKGSPILSIRRELFSSEGQPIEYLQAVYRGDRLQYHIRQ